MRTKLGTTICRTEAGFKRYVGWQDGYIESFITKYKFEPTNELNQEELEGIIDAIKIKELDNSFRSILSKEEKEAVDYYGYSEHRTKPDNFEKNISSAYEKWLMIFFSDNDMLFKPIDPARVGKIMEYVIFREKIRKVELAKRLGIDRNTLNRYIKGIKLPTLDVIYRFSVIFNVSIDWILKNATK